ncbi:MAG TPA: TIGR03936 family radical SAM-associated protein [Sedimentisphaerales bacterium]|nr:TIGR03936 family radical SAM-associated protein [Sedimentisphaerales bacterium]
MHGTTPVALIKFKIGGNLRFLSHAETIKLFQRACVRCGIRARYSQGFNPRIKMSLPLPRSVGVQAEDELLSLQLQALPETRQYSTADAEELKSRLARQLPDGCQVLSAEIKDAKSSLQPCSATYQLPVKSQLVNCRIKQRIENILAGKSLFVDRRIYGTGSRAAHKKNLYKSKTVNVRGYLKSIDLADNIIIVECGIDSTGSVRIDELLTLLEIKPEHLAAPVKRTGVKWSVSRC